MPSFTGYSDGVPVASQPPRQSPNNFHTNFTAIDGLIDTDHFSFADGTNGGWHRKSSYVAGTDPGSGSNRIVHYAKTVGSSTEEFVQRDGVVTPIQITSGLANSGTNLSSPPYTFDLNWQSFMAGAFQIKGGRVQASGGSLSTVTITYASLGLSNFPTTTLSVFITPQGNFRVYKSIPTPDRFGFTADWSPVGSVAFDWIAIGN